jgi:hypothetical protein
MVHDRVLTTFESVPKPVGARFWVFWPALSLILILGLSSVALWLNKPLDIGSLIIVLGIGAMPPVNVAIARLFRKKTSEVSELLWENSSSFDNWLKVREERLFTLKTRRAKLITTTVIVLALSTIALQGLPFDHFLISIIGISAFTIVCWICGQTLYICIDLLVTLHELSKRELRLTFYFPPDRAIWPLHSFYSILALTIASYYFVLVFGIWLGPYGFGRAMTAWVTGLAILPLAIFLFSNYLLHLMMLAAKDTYFQEIHNEIARRFDDGGWSRVVWDVERLQNLMGAQEKVQALGEWPLALGGAITLLITFALAAAQIYVTVAGT